MASRTYTFADWLKLVVKNGLGDGFKNVAGYPVADVAHKLKVHRSRVHQLIDDGALDTLSVTNASGKVALILVTEASLERYLADRVPDRNRQGYFAFPA